MSRTDAHLKPQVEGESNLTETPFASLSQTLVDLEARLTRLSGGKAPGLERPDLKGPAAPAADQAPASAAPSERLRAMTAARRERKPDLSAAVSALTVRRQLSTDAVSDVPAPKTRPTPAQAASMIERRFGTIAGEVESLQMQGATFALMKDLASDLTALRADIQGKTAPDLEPRFADLQRSFSDLKRMISDREGSDKIGAEIFEIMEALTELTASNADQGSIDALRLELDSVAAMVGQLAREESLEAVQGRWDAFETRIADRIELDVQAKRDLRVELERLRGSLRSLATEEQILAVQQRWEEFESRYIDAARPQTDETLTHFLRDELDGLRSKLDLVVAQNSEEAFIARLDAMADRLSTGEVEASVERLSVRMGEIELALVGLPEILQIDQMEQSIQALSQGIEGLAREVREPQLDQFAVIEERLDEISAAIVAATAARQVEIDMAPIERIEARVAELTARVDRLIETGEADFLSVQIAALSERIEDIGAQPADRDLGNRIDSLSERVETLFRSAGSPDATSAFEERLNGLAQRLEESASSKGLDNDVVRGLEVQIGRLADHLAGTPIVFGDEGEMTRRLEIIERQLDENRDSVIVAARTAADEAVRRMQDEDVRRESGYVRELAQDLRNLETLCRDSDERTFGVFDAVHTTLLKIVERLTAIEQEIRSEASDSRAATDAETGSVGGGTTDRIEWTAASVGAVADDESEPKGLRAAIARHMARRSGKAMNAGPDERPDMPTLAERVRPVTPEVAEPEVNPVGFVFDAPGLDAADSMVSREANRPLEPGSGAPDIAALIERVRMQQRGMEPTNSEPLAKADFIAAARKAAMAAAAEAEALRDKVDSEPGAAGKDQAGRRRKPILMAVGAVLLALMAMPLGRAYLGPEAVDGTAGTAGTQVASLDAPAALETSVAPGAPVAPEAPAVPEAPLEAPAASVEPAGESTAPAQETADSAAPVAVTDPAPADPSSQMMATAVPPVVASDPNAAPTAEPPAAGAQATVAAGEPAPAAAPAMASASAPSDPSMLADAASLMAGAQSRLPESARGSVPAVPAGIGPEALVAAVGAAEPMALFEVGLRLMEGRTGPSDPVAAMNWFAQSAARGFAPAQYSVGTLYEKGNGIGRDTGAARDWYRLAADQGNIRAMHNLAVLYATGVEGRSDPEAAAQWFVKAADHGMRDSQYNLGILYARGAGVEQNLSESYRWFSIVGQSGDKDAQTKMEEVGKTLAPDVRSRVDAEVAAWKPAARIEEANTVSIPASWSEKTGRTAAVDMTRATRNVQAILLKLGYNPGRPDGVVGEQTQTAIRQFQEKSGLKTTGEIDEPLIRALLERKDA